MTVEEVQAEIVITKAILAAIGAAFIALADPTVSSYDIDTGQSIQRVRREDLPKLLEQRRALQGELAGLETRISGAGVTRGQPAW